MRIIGGALRGRRLSAKPGDSTRPTADRVREAIASALDARGWLQDANVLDLFAGTGALAFEALSRGASAAVLVDRERAAVESMRNDSTALGLAARVQVLELDLLGRGGKAPSALLRSGLAPFTLTFVDPPYAQIEDAVRLLARLARESVLAHGAPVVIEHAQRSVLVRPECFGEIAQYRYGDTAVTLWETVASSDQT